MAKVLIVDDSAYARRVHRKILESGAHTVLEASSGLGALETFGLEKPDAVLLDLSMEDLGGIEVLEQMRAMAPATPVLVVSADVQRTTADRAREAGAVRFVGKPVTADDLLSTIASVLGEARRNA